MAQFNVAQIAGGNRVLVTGTDEFGTSGKTTLDSTQWENVKHQQAFDVATEEFDAAVEEFFAPIEAAMSALDKATQRPERDAINYVTLREAVEGTPSSPAHIVRLDKASVILRVIEAGDFARLVWVSDNELEVLEVAVEVPTPAQP